MGFISKPLCCASVETEKPAHAAAPTKRLLVVDQSPFTQLLLGPLLAQAGYSVEVATDPQRALALHADGGSPDGTVRVRASSTGRFSQMVDEARSGPQNIDQIERAGLPLC